MWQFSINYSRHGTMLKHLAQALGNFNSSKWSGGKKKDVKINMQITTYSLSLFELLFISVALGGVDGIGISENKDKNNFDFRQFYLAFGLY